MKKELSDKILNISPIIKFNYHMIECDDGWFELIYNTFSNILKIPYIEHFGIKVYQIKEKFGTLRIYYDFNNGFVNEEDYPEIQKDVIQDAVSKLIHDAEDKSAITCEICGRKGELRNDSNWIQTKCNACWLLS